MISVCLPVFNGELYIKEQLLSILPQLGGSDEIIISDDGSTDSSLKIIEEINDPRIKVFNHQKKHNPFKGSEKVIYSVATNVFNALSKASGDYIFLSDQDDIWMPEKVSTVMDKFEEGYECILHNNKVIDENCNVTSESYFLATKPSRHLYKFLSFCPYQGASMAFTKRIKELSLDYPEIPISHDHYIALKSWTHGKSISFISKPLMLYRRHGANVSHSSEKSDNSLCFKILYRLRFFKLYLLNSFRRGSKSTLLNQNSR